MTNGKSGGFELRLERLLEARRASVWRCWSEPGLLEQWFHPPSWTTRVEALDQRPGGESHIVMHGPGGEVSDGTGVFLEVAAARRLVFTNALAPGWIPSERSSALPFMTVIFIELSGEGGSTLYVVRALHWTEAARKQHEELGFHEGWTQTADQLEALARTL